MKREIVCTKCGELRPMHPEDVMNGFHRRRTVLQAKRPSDHGLAINGEFHPLASLICDHCGEKINDGDGAVAITMWQGVEPYFWESDYQTTKP